MGGKPISSVISKDTPTVGGFDTSRNSPLEQLSELLKYRELIKLLTIKDVKLRYKGSFLGFLWSLLNPLLMTFVFYIVFAVLLPTNVPVGCSQAVPANAIVNQLQIASNTPVLRGLSTVQTLVVDNQNAVSCRIYSNFTVFLFIGILAWNFTAGAVMSGMTALLGNASIAKKIYFPREVLPISTVLAQLVNFLLALIPLVFVMLFTGLIPTFYVVLLPIIIFFHALFLIGLALIFSQVLLKFRDLGIIMEVLLQAWMFLSPVFYSMQQVYKDSAQLVYWLNPMASFIESYRTLLFFNYPPDFGFTIRTCSYGLITFVIGFAFFMWRRKRIGELL